MHPPFAVRAITSADATQVIALMRAKANEDGIADEFFATEDTLRSIPEKVIVLVSHTEDEYITGYIIYSFIYSPHINRDFAWLDDIYVRPEARRSGVAQILIKAMCGHARRIGVHRIDWIYKETNNGGAAFYKKLGASVYDEYKFTRLDQFQVDIIASE